MLCENLINKKFVIIRNEEDNSITKKDDRPKKIIKLFKFSNKSKL
jgi:hypothetical protein